MGAMRLQVVAGLYNPFPTCSNDLRHAYPVDTTFQQLAKSPRFLLTISLICQPLKAELASSVATVAPSRDSTWSMAEWWQPNTAVAASNPRPQLDQNGQQILPIWSTQKHLGFFFWLHAARHPTVYFVYFVYFHVTYFDGENALVEPKVGPRNIISFQKLKIHVPHESTIPWVYPCSSKQCQAHIEKGPY